MRVVRTVVQRLASVDPRLLDGALVLALSVAGAAQLVPGGFWQVVRLPAALGTIVPLLWRRQRPITCYAVQFACALLTLEPPTLAGIVAGFLGIYSIGAHSRLRAPSLLAPLGTSLALAVLFPHSYSSLPAWGLQLLLGVGVWLAGSATRGRQLQADAMEERALRLERERELAQHVAVADERARIARELHDVVAHSVSVMVVQAGAARRLLAQRPERAGEALLEVEGSGRAALTELRRLLGLLAEEPDGATLAPQPGLGQLDTLADRLRSAGLPLDVRVAGSPRPLPAGLDLAAYRIVQEALTNVLRHAGAAPTRTLVEYGERELRLEVVNDPAAVVAEPVPGAGRGLPGMRERAAVYGGRLEAGLRPAGGFAVHVTLPLEAD